MARLKALLLLLPLTLTIAAAAWLLDRELERRMDALQAALLQEMEARLGRPIRYGSLSPSIFGFLDLRDLQIGAQENGGTLLRVNRLRVHYNLYRLLIGRDIGRSLSEISIIHSTFNVDLDRDRELLELVRRVAIQPDGAGRPGGPPAIRISGADITLDVRKGADAARLSRLFFTISSLPDAFQLSLRSAVETSGRFPASARVRLDGRIDRFQAGSDLLVRLEELHTGSFSLERQTLQFTQRGSQLDVRKIQDRAPLDLHVVCDLDEGSLLIRLMSQDFRPATMLTLQGPLQRYQPLLQNPVSVSGEVALSAAGQALRYDLDLQTRFEGKPLPFPVEVSARLIGDRELVQMRPVRLSSGQGGLEFDGSILLRNLFPDGLLRLTEVRALPGDPLNASIELARREQSVQLSGGKLVLGPLSLKDVALELTPRPDRLLFDLRTSLDGAGSPGTLRSRGQLVFRSGSAGPQVSLQALRRRLAAGTTGLGLLAGLELQADNTLEGVPLSLAHALLPSLPRLPAALEQAAGGLRLSASATLGTDFETFRLSAPLVRIEDPANRERGATTALHAGPDSVVLQDFSARWGEYRLTGELGAMLQPEREVWARIAFRWMEIPYELKAGWRPGGDLELNGSYGLAARVILPPPSPPSPVRLLPGFVLPFHLPGVRGVRFSLQAQDLPLPVPGRIGTILASTRLEGAVDGEGRLELESEQTVIRGFPLFKSRDNRLEAAFRLEDGQLQLRRLSFSDRVSTLEGDGRFAVRSLSDFDGTLQLGSRTSGESYLLQVRPGRDNPGAALTFRQSPLVRFGVTLVSGSLSGEARLEGTLAQPALSGTLSVENGSVNEDPLDLSLGLRYRPGEVRISALNLSFLTHRIREGEGRLDFAEGIFGFQSQYQGDYAGKRLRLRAVLEGTFDGMGDEARRPFALPAAASSLAPPRGVRAVNALLKQAGLQGMLQLADIHVDDRPYDPWSFAMKEENEAISLAGGPQRSILGHIDLDGNFGLVLLAPLPVRGEVSGRLTGRTIDSRFAVSYLDARVINFAAHTEVFRFTKGTGRGELRISGSVNDPDFFGRIDVSGGSMRFALSPDPVEPVEGVLVFNEKSFDLQRTVTRCGGAEVVASGTFAFDHWVPNAFELLFGVPGRSGLPIRYTFGPVRADGFAWGNVRVRGDGSSVRVTGDVLVDRCQITIQEPQPAPPPSPSADPLTVELTLNTGKRVEFFWPSIRFPIVRTFARQGAKVSLLSDGGEKSLAMNGEVDTRGGEIFYFDRSFYLKEGRITFRERGSEFDPRIQALAELRERDQDNEQIRIYLQVNDKLSRFFPRFYSVPARTDSEIISLIGGSLAGRVGETRPEISAMLLASDVASQFFIMRPFEQAVRDLLHLDMFSIRTQMVQNVLFGKLLGSQLSGGGLNPLDNTTLSLGKYLGTDLFLEMLLRFQTTDVASAPFGSSGQVRTEGELSFEWQTPLFLLEWTFTPRHPETLFLTDNSLGISWGFSY